MKLKLKPIIITSVVTFSATVALAVGLSYIPFGDKKIEASGSKRFQDVVHSAPGLPVTTENNDSIKDVKSDYKTPLDLRASSPNIIKESEKVKYVALGDSISAGFDSQLDKDYPGNYDKEKNEVTGISFPTYLASFIKNSNADNSKLESYTNYASSGTTLEDWKFLLTVDESKLKELAEKDKNKLAYYKTKFGEDIIERAKQVKEELQKANLVTITLAANDFMELVAKKLKDPKFIEQIQNIKANPTNAIAGVSSAFQDTFKEMKKRIDDFSAELKKHVKTENVNFIGYPLPLPHLFVLLDGYLFKNNGSSLIVSQMAVESLNKNIQSQVTKNKFNFINPYDFSFWTDNSNINKLSPTLFDIHPGSFGYKKMAQDVFIKLIVPERNSDKLNENGIKWDNKYIFTDKDSFTTQLEFANQYKTVKKVLTDDINGNLFKEDEIFKKFSDKRKNKWEWYKKRVLNSSLVKNILNGAIDSLIQFPTIKEADPSSRLSNFFTKNNNENLNKLKKWLDESEFVPNFLLKSEIEFQETYWNKDKKSSSERAKLFDLINIFKNNLLNEANLISLIASFFSSDLIQKEKEELKEIIAEFAQNLIIKNVDEKMLSDAINKALGDNSSKAFKTENLAKLIKSVLSSNSIKKTIGELFINLANNSKIYGQAKSVAELLQKVLKDSHIQKTISDLASSLFDELSKEGALNKEFTNFVFEIVKSNNELFKDIDESSLKELLSKNIKGIGALDKEFKISETFINSLSVQLQEGKISDFNFANVLAQTLSKLSKNFEGENLDITLIKIFKIIANLDLKANKATLEKILTNSLNYFNKNSDLSKLIAQKIYQTSENKLSDIISNEKMISLFDKIFKSSEFSKAASSLISALADIDKNELEKANSIKMLLNRAVHSLKNNRTKTYLVQFAKEFINFEESNKLLKNLFDSIGSIKGKNSFSLDQIKELVNYLADDKDLQELTISLLTDGFFSDKMSLSDFNDYDKLIKTWLGNPDVKKSVLKNVKNIISKAFNKSSIRHTFATIIYKLMQSEKLLIENITDNDLIALISDSLQNYEKVNNLLDFNGWFLDGVFDELAKNGTKIDNKAIEKLATENLKDKFSYENWEKTAIGLIKSLATTEIVLNHEDTIGQFVANIFSYSAGSKNAGSLIYDQILNSYGDKISQYIQKDKFNELIKTVFVKNQKAFASIMKNITLSMKQDINKYHNAQSIIDIFKIYFDQEEKIYLILKDLSVVVESLLKDETIKGLIKKLLSEQLKQYSVDVDSDENKKFFSALLNELPSLINDLHLLSNVLTGINSGLKEYKNITSLFSDIISLTLKSIKFKDFTLAKVILDSKTLEKHHKVLGANIAKIVEGASSNDELVSKFIDDFGLTKLLSSKGISDLDAKELFKSILKSGDTKGALSLFINEFFKDTSKFKNVNSWAKLISTLVGAVDETKVKEHIKKWMRQIVNKTDNKLFDVMANLLTEQFNKNGYSIPEWENTKISKFLSSITKSIVGGETEQKDQDILSILNDIIDGIFTALKGLKDEDDILSKIAEAAKNGALKFITDNNSISIAKVFDNIPKFQKLLDKVDAKAYADFINVMFKYAHPSDDKGLFKAIFHSDKSSSNNTSLGFKGFWGVIQGKVQQLISAFVTPLMKNYVQELIDTQKVYKTAQEVKEKIEGYQAVWRVYASLAAMLYSNTPSGLFWNATNWTSEGFLRAGFKDAFEKAIKGINLVKYKGNYAAIGLKKENEVNQEFWAGVSPLRHSSTSNGLRWWRYARDYVLAYVYYQDNKDDKYHKRTGKTMRQVLIEDLIKGYMPVQK